MSFKSLDTIFKTVDPQDFHQDRCSGRGVAHRFRDLDWVVGSVMLLKHA